MYNGTVFTDIQERAFLSIAANEGLISERGISDGLFDSIKQTVPSFTLAQKLLEKFCVAGKVFISPFIFKFLEGELVDREIILPYSEKRTHLNGIICDPYTIQYILEEKGYDTTHYTVDKISKELEDWKKKAKELTDFYEKHPNFKTEWLRLVMGLECDTLSEKERVYYTKLEREVFDNILYIITQEYINLVEIAYQNNLLCPVKISTDNNKVDYYSLSSQNKLIESETAVQISKYTSEALGRIYFAGSLRDCITLTQSDAAIAYRQKIDEFVTSLSIQDFDSIERINQELSKAQSAMKLEAGCVKTQEVCGKIVATAGALGQTASLMYPNTLIGNIGSGISIFATYLSIPLSFINPAKQESYLWTSYGLYY